MSRSALHRRTVMARLLQDRGGLLVLTGLGTSTWRQFLTARSIFRCGARWAARTASFELGLALAQPERRVVVFNGDGDMLMALGSLSTIAVVRLANLRLVVLDNELYGETGAQATHTAAGVDLASVARAFGFPKALTVTEDHQLEDLRRDLYTHQGPLLAMVKVTPSPDPMALPPREGTFLKNRMKAAPLGPEAIPRINRTIDLNADAGESYGAWTLGDDAALFSLLSSVNTACGFHTGDPLTIHRAVALAREHHLGIGAHPSYPDLPGFGRRILEAAPDQVYTDVLYQISALSGMCRVAGVPLRHVKAHGALSTRAWTHAPTAAAITQATRDADPWLLLIVLTANLLETEARRLSLPVVLETFPERAYLCDGRLDLRSLPSSNIHDPQEADRRALLKPTDLRLMRLEPTSSTLSSSRTPLLVLQLFSVRFEHALANHAVHSGPNLI